MADENFDFNLLEGGVDNSSEDSAGASLENVSETSTEGMVDEALDNVSRSQPQNPRVESTKVQEEYSARERALLDRIEQLTSQAYQGQQTKTADTSAFSPQEHNFLDGLDIDEVLSSGENLNKLLLAVYNKGLEQSIQMNQQNWSATAPDLVREHVAQHMSMRELVDSFYETNPDLVSVRKTVGAIANEVSQENSELTIEEVFAEAAKRTREALGLPATPPERSDVQKPNLPQRRQPGNRRNGTPTLTGVAKEIDDLLF